jgi:hypothetical protein
VWRIAPASASTGARRAVEAVVETPGAMRISRRRRSRTSVAGLPQEFHEPLDGGERASATAPHGCMSLDAFVPAYRRT